MKILKTVSFFTFTLFVSFSAYSSGTPNVITVSYSRCFEDLPNNQRLLDGVKKEAARECIRSYGSLESCTINEETFQVERRFASHRYCDEQSPYLGDSTIVINRKN